MAGVFFQPRILGLGIILSLTLRLRVALSKLLETSNSEEKTAMLKYEEAFPNVLRFRLDGSIVWQAELPTQSNDVYTNLEWMESCTPLAGPVCQFYLMKTQAKLFQVSNYNIHLRSYDTRLITLKGDSHFYDSIF
jgi:hypothetical protein